MTNNVANIADSDRKGREKRARIAGFSLLATAALAGIALSTRQQVDNQLGSTTDESEAYYEDTEVREIQARISKWLKLDSLADYVKKNPGKDFDFYKKYIVTKMNDPTAPIDGDKRSEQEEIVDYVQGEINQNGITPQELGMTEKQWETLRMPRG